MTTPRSHAPGLATALLALVIDQSSKALALSQFDFGEQRLVNSFFNVHLGLNEGVSFGLLASTFEGRPYLLAVMTLLIALLLAGWMWRATDRREAMSLGLIVGGALSNILDRLRIGAVVDYLDFHAGGIHWPAFNLADVAIVLGVAALVAKSLLPARPADHNQRAPR